MKTTINMKMAVPDQALFVCYTLQSRGFQAVVVGGCVRDSILGREPKDWDVATSALPVTVQGIFDNTLPTGIDFGTVTVRIDGEEIEVTTFRSEGDYSDGRHPDSVEFSADLQTDLSRRDFTMNAMAYDPVAEWVFDPFSGRGHLQMGVIRCVGRAKDRFNEDGLRMLRALRFKATLGLKLDDEIISGIRSSLASLSGVSPERFRDELVKLVSAPKPRHALHLALITGVLPTFIPELSASLGHAQNQWHAFDVWDHTIRVVEAIQGDSLRRVGALFHDVGKPASAEPAYGPGQFSFHDHEDVGAEMTEDIMTRLKFSNDDKARVVGMVQHHMFGYDPGSADSPATSDKALRRFIKKAGAALVPDLVALRIADIEGKGLGEGPEVKLAGIRERIWAVMGEIASGKAAVSTNQLAINGRDIMTELGIDPGKEVGVILKALLDRVLDEPEMNQRESLLKLLPEMRCG